MIGGGGLCGRSVAGRLYCGSVVMWRVMAGEVGGLKVEGG